MTSYRVAQSKVRDGDNGTAMHNFPIVDAAENGATALHYPQTRRQLTEAWRGPLKLQYLIRNDLSKWLREA